MKKKRPTGMTYKPKTENIQKLKIFLKKIENGK
jgi:hypothetical protein